MNARTLEQRVESLEKSIEPLRELPGRVSGLESQIVQLRTEMREEFSAIRSEMVTSDGLAAEFDRRGLVTRQDLAAEFDRRDLVTKSDLKRELNHELERFATRDDLARTNRRLRDGFKDLKAQMLSLHDGLKSEMLSLHDGLKSEMLSLHDGLKTQMLVLHQDLVGRLKLLSEGGGTPKRARARKRR